MFLCHADRIVFIVCWFLYRWNLLISVKT